MLGSVVPGNGKRHGFKAVSYTHLMISDGTLKRFATLELPSTNRYAPVSYTHLDVYKRQTYDSLKIYWAIAIIGLTTFVLSIIGVIVGNFFGNKYKKKSEIAGGIILILIGVKILLEHLGIISF